MGVILFWFGFSVVVGIAASNRGRSGFGWFLLSLLISPLLSLILVLVMKDLSEVEPPRRERIIIRERGPLLEIPDAEESRVDKLERLARLREKGLLSEGEYEREKRRLLG